MAKKAAKKAAKPAPPAAKKAAAKPAAKAAKKAAAKPAKKAAGKTAKKAPALSNERLAEMLHFVSKQLDAAHASSSGGAAPVISFGATGGAGGQQPAKPGKEVIAPRVREVIKNEAKNNGASAGKLASLEAGGNLTLETELNINGGRRRALHEDYQNISTDYIGGIKVGQLEAEDATTVNKAIDLVHKMANGG